MFFSFASSRKKFFLLTTLIVSAMIMQAYAATGDSTIYAGIIQLKGGGQFAYKLCLQDSADMLHGYSLTDVRGANETKTAVSGKRRTDKSLELHEKQVIYTKSKSKDFCFIHASLKWSEIKDVPILKGTFSGLKADGKTACGSGTMTLYGAEKLLKKLESIAPERTATDTLPATIAPKTPDTFALTNKRPWRIRTKDSTMRLQVWDNNRVDGDVVSVFLNGVVVHEQLRLNNQIIELSLPLVHPGQNIIEVLSVSEGSEPPNTAMIRLVTSKGAAVAQADLNQGERGTITVDCF